MAVIHPIRKHLPRRSFTVLPLLLLGCAQTAPPPAPALDPGSATAVFLPRDYQAEMVTDWAALRDIGLVAALERLPAVTDFFDQLAAGHCCDFDQLRRVRTALVLDPEGTGRSMRMVSIAEIDGTAKLPADGDHWKEYAAAGFTGRQSTGGAYTLVAVAPGSGLVVTGEHELLDPLLRGVRPAGGAHPDLAAFAAGDGVLAQYAAGTFGRPAHAVTATVGFPGHHDADDPCEFVRLRLAADRDGQLAASLTLRYRRGSANLRRTEQDFRARFDEWSAAPEFAALAPLLREVVIAHDDRDLHVRWDLGSPNTALRKLERAALALMSMGPRARPATRQR